jgi:hypothetical protein
MADLRLLLLYLSIVDLESIKKTSYGSLDTMTGNINEINQHILTKIITAFFTAFLRNIFLHLKARKTLVQCKYCSFYKV